MLLHLPLIQAASWLSTLVPKSKKISQHRFHEFVSGMEKADAIDSNPLTTWLVPDWLKYLDKMEEPVQEPPTEIKDSDLEGILEKLRNPAIDNIAEMHQEAVVPISMHSQMTAKKIAGCLAHAREAGMNWESGLKRHACCIANNLAIFPAWLDEASVGTFRMAIQFASLFELSGSNPYSCWISIPSIQTTYHGRNQGNALSESDQIQYATNLVVMLKSDPTLAPGKFHELIRLLIGIWRGFLQEKRHGLMYLRMIPIGRRFAMSTLSRAEYPAILDMIKAEDGFVYGIKYVPRETFHAPTLAFCLPHQQLPALLDFLNGPYSSLNDIDKVPEVRCRSLNLKWYSGKDTVLEIVRHFAHVWGSDEHLRLGIIDFYCRTFLELKKGHAKVESLEQRQFLLELIELITAENASLLATAYSKLELPPVPLDDETAIQARELFGVIKRALIARI